MSDYRLTIEAWNTVHPEFGSVQITADVHGEDLDESVQALRTIYVSEDGEVNFTGGLGPRTSWYPEWRIVESVEIEGEA